MVSTIDRPTISGSPPVSGGLSPEDLATLESIERRLLWLSTLIVHHANNVRPNPEKGKVGGHQASSASVVRRRRTSDASEVIALSIVTSFVGMPKKKPGAANHGPCSAPTLTSCECWRRATKFAPSPSAPSGASAQAVGPSPADRCRSPWSEPGTS